METANDLQEVLKQRERAVLVAQAPDEPQEVQCENTPGGWEERATPSLMSY